MSLWQNKTIEERIAIIQNVSSEKNLEELVVEKDWWVTVTLKALFSTSFSDDLSFKGGTSLSKGWKSIDLKRFSEDIDIAISRGWFTRDEKSKQLYPFAACETNNQIKQLRKALRKIVFEQLAAELDQQLQSIGISGYTIEKVTTEETAKGTVEIDSDRDPVIINVIFESILEEKNQYIQPKVKIEISGLSMDEPIENRTISSTIYDKYPDVDNDSLCTIPTVLPIRTFLEKAFLLNEEYQKKSPRTERMSRHLYDLEKLMDTCSKDALADDKLYNDIIAHRMKFYHIGTVDYNKDKKENIIIWPNDLLEPEYEKDYKAMTESFIYDDSPLSYSDLKKRINKLEETFRNSKSRNP
ncbi:MAG: nucleotidyl transferase AbiEii/AbiGii toxin family protein [Bacteroides sp.]|jgi:hypothetical protein|nr:nucleotidyl transferase AbiEii/AbiGii toxin family protein [Bacteroides sp.]